MNKSSNIEYVNCILCNSGEATYLADYSYHGERLSIVECKKCGLIYTNPRLTKEREIELFQDSYFNLADEEAWGVNRLPNYRALLDKLEKFHRPGRLLDMGCGFGHFLKFARVRGWECYGVEPSKAACDYARNNLDFNVIQGELREGSFSTNFFDAVVLWDVLYLFSDPVSELNKINRIMKEGGVLGIRIVTNKGPFMKLFLVLSNLHFVKRKSSSYYPFWNPDWLYNFSRKNLNRLLKNSGFNIVHIYNAVQVKRPNLSCRARFLRKLYSLFSNLIFCVSFGRAALGPALTIVAKKVKTI